MNISGKISRINKVIFSALALVFFSLVSLTTYAQHDGHNKEEENHVGPNMTETHEGDKKFDMTEFAIHHVMDSHEFHLWGEDESAVTLALPIILFGDNGMDVFMSSAFDHKTGIATTDKGKYWLHHGHIYNFDSNIITDEVLADAHKHEEVHVDTDKLSKPWDFSITRNVFSMLLSAIILILVFVAVAKGYKKRPGAPKGLQSFMEPLVLFVRDDIAKPNIGHKYEKYMPYLLTTFFFIWLNNIIGLIPFFPGGSNVTGNISFTLTMSVIALLVIVFSGNKNYWMHIFNTPGVPWWLKVPIPLMPIVELAGVISKPFALMIRLFANITAGHIIVLSLVGLIFILKTAWVSPASIALALFIDVLEILVAALQAYVFTMLAALFIGSAVEEAHH